MTYSKKIWLDQDVERPKTYEVSENQDGSITLVDSFGAVNELGTPVNAANMNHIEDGIAACAIRKYSASETFEEGEWVLGTAGGIKSIYSSKTDNNLGQSLTDSAYWEKADLNSAKIGEITFYSIATPPSGWLVCDGSAISRTTYANLFSVIGTTHGPGDGSTTFNLPSMIDRYTFGSWYVGALTSETLTATGTESSSHAHAYVAGQYTAFTTDIENAAHTHTYIKGVYGIGLLPIIKY